MHPVSCLTTPPPPPACAADPAAAALSMHSETPSRTRGIGLTTHCGSRLCWAACATSGGRTCMAASVKDQIWRGDFVRLGVLIRKDPGFGEETQASVCLTSARSSLLLRPQSKNTCHLFNRTIDVAFPYSIILERHPSRARELVKLMDIVRSITRFGGYNWRPYDVQ